MSSTDRIVLAYDELNNNDDEVERRTEFRSLKHLLAFVIIVCNSDHDVMIEKTSKLTWLEEWVFYFEFLWGKTLTIWQDTGVAYNIHRT